MMATSRNPAATKEVRSAGLLLGQWMQWEDPIAREHPFRQSPHSLPARNFFQKCRKKKEIQ